MKKHERQTVMFPLRMEFISSVTTFSVPPFLSWYQIAPTGRPSTSQVGLILLVSSLREFRRSVSSFVQSSLLSSSRPSLFSIGQYLYTGGMNPGLETILPKPRSLAAVSKLISPQCSRKACTRIIAQASPA